MGDIVIVDETSGISSNLNLSPSNRGQQRVTLSENMPITSTSSRSNENLGRSVPPGHTPYTITVNVDRTKDGFGFSVAWTCPPRVERVEPELSADMAGLKTGDYLIFVGPHNVVKMDEDSVLDIIRDCGNRLSLEVYRPGVSRTPNGNNSNGLVKPQMTQTSTSLHPLDSQRRKRLAHITFSNQDDGVSRQSAIYKLINCEQKFSHSCRFGLERYFIPLRFRGDLVTESQHEQLFNNIEQLLELSELLVDRLMGNDEDESDPIGGDVGQVYYNMVDDIISLYSWYLEGVPEADKILASRLRNEDFKDFLLNPSIPRKKPDITTFVHLPVEHLRELLGFLQELYSVSGGHSDIPYLDTVIDKFRNLYREMIERQNIMEPAPTGPNGNSNCNSPSRGPHSLRPPLISVVDIEQRLVFTKFTQPIRLNDGKRQWLFGGELHKFEGRKLKQYWVMLFSDLLLFTKINRDRVIFVMEDPIPINSVIHGLFNIKRKPTEFRLIIDGRVKIDSEAQGMMKSPLKSNKDSKKTNAKVNQNKERLGVCGKAHRKTLVLRAPTIELKAAWNNLLQRQLYLCQASVIRDHINSTENETSTSLARAASTDGLDSIRLNSNQARSSSLTDLRPSKTGEEISLNLDSDTPGLGSSNSVHRDSTQNDRNRSALSARREGLELPIPSILVSSNPSVSNHSSSNFNNNNSSQSDDQFEDYEEEEYDEDEDDALIEEIRTGRITHYNPEKKSIGKKIKNKMFAHRPPNQKQMGSSKIVKKYVESINTSDFDGRVTPLFEGEENLMSPDFKKKRDEMLSIKPKNFIDGDIEEIAFSPRSIYAEEEDKVIIRPQELEGLASSRGLKRYGSSCDVTRFGMGDTINEPTSDRSSRQSRLDDFNGNVSRTFPRKSKIGGTKTGTFVAGKLAMFEKVAEEEHKKLIECQEARKKIQRCPQKSAEYLEKFYSPQIIESIDARASTDDRFKTKYEDIYEDCLSRSRSSSPSNETRICTPPPVNSHTLFAGYKGSTPHSYYPPISPTPSKGSLRLSPTVQIPKIITPDNSYVNDQSTSQSSQGYYSATSPYSSSRFVDDEPEYESTSCVYEQEDSELSKREDEVMDLLEQSIQGSNSNSFHQESVEEEEEDEVEDLYSNRMSSMQKNKYDSMDNEDYMFEDETSLHDRESTDSIYRPTYSSYTDSPMVTRKMAENKSSPTCCSPKKLQNTSSDSFDSTEFHDADSTVDSLSPSGNTPSSQESKKSSGGFLGRSKKEKDKKIKDKDKSSGIRFPLFSGKKKDKQSEEGTPHKGKRKLFGRNKDSPKKNMPKEISGSTGVLASSFDEDGEEEVI